MVKPRGYLWVERKRNILSNYLISNGKKRLVIDDQEINCENVKKALNAKVILDLNNQTFFKNKDGTCPSLIQVALDTIDNDEAQLFQFLMDQGVKFSFTKPPPQRLLMYITSEPSRQNFDLIKKIIDAGADINYHELKGRPNNKIVPLVKVLIDKRLDLVDLFIKSGANLNPPCISGIWCAGCVPLPFAIQYEYDDLVDLLLKNGADVNLYCGIGGSPLHWATINNNTELMKRLLDHGANINSSLHRGETALHLALKNDNLEALKILLSNESIDLNVLYSFSQCSIVHYAILYKSLKCIDCLLDANPDVNVFDLNNKLAIESEYITDFEDVEKLKKHIIRLHAANFFLNDRNLAAVSEEEYECFYAECCQQVDLMKKIPIATISHVNFYDLLFMSDQKLTLCLESLDYQENLLFEFHALFPSYAGMIEYKLNKAIQWVKLREALNDSVYSLFNTHLPCLIMEKIFSYLSVNELKKLQNYSEQKFPGKSDERLHEIFLR